MRTRLTLILMSLLACSIFGVASSTSYTGTLGGGQPGNTCSDVYAASCYFTLTFNLASASNITIQSWGFGGTNGGTNAAGNPISAGGFDELIALWSGTGAGATLIDGSADNQSNYASYTGCPPAGTVKFPLGDNQCGDLTMQFSLAAGSYTITLSDANYVPLALSGGGTIGDGFSDFTGGDLYACSINNDPNLNNDCFDPLSADWAFDVTSTQVPEPTTLALVGGGLGWLWRRRRSRR